MGQAVPGGEGPWGRWCQEARGRGAGGARRRGAVGQAVPGGEGPWGRRCAVGRTHAGLATCRATRRSLSSARLSGSCGMAVLGAAPPLAKPTTRKRPPQPRARKATFGRSGFGSGLGFRVRVRGRGRVRVGFRLGVRVRVGGVRGRGGGAPRPARRPRDRARRRPRRTLPPRPARP